MNKSLKIFLRLPPVPWLGSALGVIVSMLLYGQNLKVHMLLLSVELVYGAFLFFKSTNFLKVYSRSTKDRITRHLLLFELVASCANLLAGVVIMALTFFRLVGEQRPLFD